MLDSDLSILAQQVVNETSPLANTRARVGGLFQDIVDSKVNRLDGVPVTVKVSLSSSDILGLGTEKVIIAAPGAGKVIMPISVIYKMNFGTASYATNTAIVGTYAGGGGNILASNSIITVSANTIARFNPANVQFSVDIANKALVLIVTAGNPTTGDGTLDVYITYAIIAL